MRTLVIKLPEKVLSGDITQFDFCLMFYRVAEAAVLRLPGLG